MDKMDRKVKAKWLRALRSGEYKQGKEALYRIDPKGEHRFCCLGVLAHIASQKPWKWSHENEDGTYFETQGRTGCLPFPLEREVKMPNGAEDKLVRMNDGGKSFKTIANWIEKNL